MLNNLSISRPIIIGKRPKILNQNNTEPISLRKLNNFSYSDMDTDSIADPTYNPVSKYKTFSRNSENKTSVFEKLNNSLITVYVNQIEINTDLDFIPIFNNIDEAKTILPNQF